ncbi:MAG TPA: hypothetical protein VGP36_05915 [Mycobacteriales bacterium]|jgi:hypothetical protein|nr:hypothetical protein [Mycobacteriales bacterium]
MSTFGKASPVETTYLPLVRCAVCSKTVAHRPGEASAVLTKHYRQAHPELVGAE